ncbi:MAG: hypothetical protein M3R38_03895 [Actinomycetota bacterium]|nr:hypothetical protein [Actinomycetota bacterium]
MGRARPPQQTPPPQQQPTPEEGAAAAIAAILIAGGAGMVAAIAAELALLLPASLAGALRSSLSLDVAEVVVADPIEPPRGLNGNVGAYMEEVAYRAMYGVRAAQRLGGAAVSGEEGALTKAWAREGNLYRMHREAQDRRQRGRALNQAAAERFGFILSWRHTETAKTHRPAHVRANGKNFDVRNPPRATDGMLPGQAMHCDCVPGPPIRGARMLR